MIKFFKIHIISSLLMISGVIGIMFSSSLVTYEHQIDVRKREYYPATVVDKFSYDRCSKYDCKVYYVVAIQLEDGTYDKVDTSSDSYNEAVVGEQINFERHITDPKVKAEMFTRSMLFSFSVFAMLIGFFTLMLSRFW